MPTGSSHARLTAGQLAEFEELAHRVTGLTLARGGRDAAERAVTEALASSGTGWDEFMAALCSPGARARVEDLVAEATVKETYFFRSPAQFRALAGPVLEEVAEARGSVRVGAPRPLRVWSAGCATGEEAWSIASALLGAIRHRGAWDIEVLATDLSEAALAIGRRGRYPSVRLPSAAADLMPMLDRFLPMGADGVREASPEARSVVRFERNNLAADPEPSDRDVVFCRNVMIYMPISEQPRLIERLSRSLRPGGWLFLGDAELLHLHDHDLESVDVGGALAYRKPGGPDLGAMRRGVA